MTSKILVTGGSGTLGRHILPFLLKAGNVVRLASRSERKNGFPAGIEWAQTSLETGEGLTEAIHGMDTILHLASDPRQPQRVDVEGTQRLLARAKIASVSHFIYISIVGIEHFPGFAYYRAKLAAEQLIENSGIPYTILRATQFHELLDLYFLPPLLKLPLVAFVPTSIKYQLIDSEEVAQRLAELAQAKPAGHVPDIGGPQILTMGEIARTWAQARGINRHIIHLPIPGQTAAGFRKGFLTCPNNRFGKITWEQYLRRKYTKTTESLNLPESA